MCSDCAEEEATVRRQAATPALTTAATIAPDIAALDLEPVAQAAAIELRGKQATVTFTSGRRTVPEQASAMGQNIVSSGNRNWITDTYVTSAGVRALQKWLNDNPTVTDEAGMAAGLAGVLNGLTATQQGYVSKHLLGKAFDVQPVTENAAAIEADIRGLKGIDKFLEREADLVRWHAQFKRASPSSGNDLQRVPDDFASGVRSLQGGGHPLPGSTREFFEPRFGRDLGDIRIHADARAADMAQSVNARAFTVGSDVAFAAGQYSPETANGRELLAHELTHVVQQRGHSNQIAQRDVEPEEGRREGTIKVRWVNDDRDFYHRVINAIARSPAFRGIEKAAFWQPFHDLVFDLYRRLSLQIGDREAPAPLEFRVSVWFDPSAYHGQLSGAWIEHEQTAHIKESKITAVVKPRVAAPGRGSTALSPGDVADVSFTAEPPATAESFGGLKWTAGTPYYRSGSGTMSGGNDGTAVFTAGFPGRVRLELRIASGFSAGRIVSSQDVTISIDGMLEPDPDRPERQIIKKPGLTPEMVADFLYGDRSKVGAIWVVWDEKARGGPLTGNTALPVGIWVGFEYRHLKPNLKAVYDSSLSITERAEWGAKPPVLDDPKREYKAYSGPLEDVLDSIVVHHAGNEGHKTMMEVQNYHLSKKDPSADIDYHFGINLAGEVFEGRPINIVGAHVSGGNTGKIGIVLLADLDPENKGMRWYQVDRSNDPLTPQMEASLVRLIHYLKGKYPKVQLLGGHSEFDKRRFCPGKTAMDKMNAWRSDTNLAPPP